MKKFSFLFIALAALEIVCACDDKTTSIECFATVTDSLIKEVVVSEGNIVTTYSYEYDTVNILKKVIVSYNNQEPDIEYLYTWKKDSIVEVTNNRYTHCLLFNEARCLQQYVLIYDSDEVADIRFEYVDSSLSNVTDGSELNLEYEWDGMDISVISDHDDSLRHKYQYTDIIDNFNIAIPELTHIFTYPLAFFTKSGMNSLHLESSSSHFIDDISSHRQLYYERNSEGDICLIRSTEGKTWELVYY